MHNGPIEQTSSEISLTIYGEALFRCSPFMALTWPKKSRTTFQNFFFNWMTITFVSRLLVKWCFVILRISKANGHQGPFREYPRLLPPPKRIIIIILKAQLKNKLNHNKPMTFWLSVYTRLYRHCYFQCILCRFNYLLENINTLV